MTFNDVSITFYVIKIDRKTLNCHDQRSKSYQENRLHGWLSKIRAKVNSMVRSTGLSGVTLSGKTSSQYYIRYADKNVDYKKALELLTIQIWKFTKKSNLHRWMSCWSWSESLLIAMWKQIQLFYDNVRHFARFGTISTVERYTNVDLKISLYVCVDIKTIP